MSSRSRTATASESDLGDETPRGRDPRELAVAAKERVLAENAEEIRKIGKRVGGDVIEIGRRLTEMKKMCGVYENVALLALDLLARIIAMRIDSGPPFRRSSRSGCR